MVPEKKGWSKGNFSLRSNSVQLPSIKQNLNAFFSFFLFTFFLNVNRIWKRLLNLLQYCFCFMFLFSGHEACGILAPQSRIKPPPPALEGKVLTSRPPGKSLNHFLIWGKKNISKFSIFPPILTSVPQNHSNFDFFITRFW